MGRAIDIGSFTVMCVMMGVVCKTANLTETNRTHDMELTQCQHKVENLSSILRGVVADIKSVLSSEQTTDMTDSLQNILDRLERLEQGGLFDRLERLEQDGVFARLEQMEQRADEPKGGAIYTRWGRTTCSEEAEIVYTGFAGGSFYNHQGGGSNYLCLSRNPSYANHDDTDYGKSYVYGAEYEGYRNGNFPFDLSDDTLLADNDVPCVVCRVPQASAVLMIPARTSCDDGWRQEYQGYLMSGHHVHHRAEFVCVDKSPETATGGNANQNGALFYNVAGRCGSLPCPPYHENWELACVVCSM